MSKTRKTLPILALAALFAAGCSSGLPGGEEVGSENNLGPHKMPFNSSGLNNDSAPSGAHLTYYGGPVISNVKVFTVFWGGASAVNYSSQLNAFYTGITNSAYFDWLSEYDTPTQSIGRGSFGGTYSFDNAPTGTIDDSAIQSQLQSLISSGAVPAPDANTLYAIHFASGINITQGGSQSCVQFCAYHGTIQNGSGYIYYSVIPDQGGSCAGGCGSDHNPFNNTTSVSSHEMIESTTDAAVGLATTNGPPLAWYDQTNGEIGDICNAQQDTVVGGDGNTYTIQKEFSNSVGDCISTNPGAGSSSSSSGGSSSSGSTSSSSGGSSSSSSSSSGGSSSSSSGGGGGCDHALCSTGDVLDPTCDPCVAQLCGQDPYCCNTTWDDTCVGEVGSICGNTCP